MTPLAELGLMLRPAGGGLHTVSTGRGAQLDFQRAYYQAVDREQVETGWSTALASVASAKVAILGVPSDSGAGLVRGAAFGPQELRAAVLAAEPGFCARAAHDGVVDVGDVAVIPHLLADEMVSDAQIVACQAALYPSLERSEAAALPVAPLSITERVADHLLTLNPGIRILLLGGDHSVAWPLVAALGRHVAEPWAIVQPDAHTDLLPERLGVRYCFATWAYHANDLLGRGGRLVQVGIRASGRTREHWESTLGVRQFWASDVRARGEAATITAIADHLRGLGVRRVYFSNDIDGTDALLAPSTGAPEPDGLSAEFITALVTRLAQDFSLLGADLVEIAPPVGSADDSRRTLAIGASYFLAELGALLTSPRS